MGAKVRAFEERFAAWVGAEHAVMVNSGSSALLVMLSALVEQGRLRPGQEVLVPAVGCPSLFSVHQARLSPVRWTWIPTASAWRAPSTGRPCWCICWTTQRGDGPPHPRGRLRRPRRHLHPASRSRAGCFSFFFSHP